MQITTCSGLSSSAVQANHSSITSASTSFCRWRWAHYLIAHLNDGTYGGVQILSEAGIGELHQGAADVGAMGLSLRRYGMGWFVDEIGDGILLWHSGINPDFAAYMALLPEQRKGVVLLFNAGHHWMNPAISDFGTGVAALVAGEQPAPVPFVGLIPWILRAQLLIPAVCLLSAMATLRFLRIRDAAGSQPLAGRRLSSYLLPLIPDLAIALTLIPVLSKRRGYLMLYMPDYSRIALICGSLSLSLALLRTGKILSVLRTP